jgi:nucleoside-diphosphate-sugar epimerase
VFHTASPFHHKASEAREMVEPAVNGTLTALREAARAGVRRVVLTSSTAAVIQGSKPSSASQVWTDADWSNEEWLRETKGHYSLSKTLAERAAWDFVAKEKPSFDLVVMNPTLITGPMLQPTLNTSCEMVRDIAIGKRPSLSNEIMGYVDVRDVSFAHVQAASVPEAGGRRFLLIVAHVPWTEIAEVIRAALPESLRGRLTTTTVDKGPQDNFPYDTTPAQTILGVKFTSLQQTIQDTVDSLIKDHFLD